MKLQPAIITILLLIPSGHVSYLCIHDLFGV